MALIFHTIIALIVGLLFCGSPPDVAGKVAFIVPDSINASVPWTLSDFGKKDFKGFDPSRINSDTAPTIIRVISVVRIKASLNHGCPSCVGTAAILVPSAMPMLEVIPLLPDAPAGLGVPDAKGHVHYRLLSPAVTSAERCASGVFRLGFSDDGKPSEACSNLELNWF